jgi:hypothetical protein
MNSPDPASLQNLNDIVLPASVGWWPLTMGWYVLIGLSLSLLVWFAYRFLRRWVNDRYRRAALRQLQILVEQIEDAEDRDAILRQIPILLKRCALSAYPRNQVASLTGQDWFEFLNSTTHSPFFTVNTARTLSKISYSSGELSTVDSQASTALFQATRQWLEKHEPSIQLVEGKKT